MLSYVEKGYLKEKKYEFEEKLVVNKESVPRK